MAMRAREVGAPTPAELAEAERDVVLVRRNYVPPTAFGAGRGSERGREQRGRGVARD